MDLASLRARLTPLEQAGSTAALIQEGRPLLARVEPGSLEEAYLTYLLGRALAAEASWREALPLLRRAVRLRPDLSHGHYLLGCCHAQEKLWPAALEAFRRCCGLDPGFAQGWWEQGRAATELGDLRLALACFKQAERLDPTSLWACSHRKRLEVLLALGAGATAEAAACIREALRGDLPQASVLQEWLTLTCDWILVGDFSSAWSLAQALSLDTATVEACSQALPRRPALLLQLLLGLLEQSLLPQAVAAVPALQELLWLPLTVAEQSLGQDRLHLAMRMLLGRLQERSPLPDVQKRVLRTLLKAATPLTPMEWRQGVHWKALLALDPQGLWQVAAVDVLERPLEAMGDTPPGAVDGPFVRATARLLLADQDGERFLAGVPEALQEAKSLFVQRPADSRLRRWLDQILWRANHLAMTPATRLVVQPGRLEKALALREQGLEVLTTSTRGFAQLDGQPAHSAPARARRHWLLVATDDLPQCFLYRVEQKRQQLEGLGCQVELLLRDQLNTWSWCERLLWADAVVVCRLPATYPVLRFLALARRWGRPIYYDIDDLIFDPQHCPPPLASYGGTIDPVLHRSFSLDVPLFRRAMEQADALIVSTSTLAQRWLALDEGRRPVMVLPNLAPPELLRAASPPILRPDSPVRLVFASGTKAHKQAWQEELAPALARVLEVNPGVRLDLLGHVDLPDVLLSHSDQIRSLPYTHYERYLQQLGQADIGLVVLEPGVFTDGKSAIRWMEFSILGVASILSPTATYRELLHDQEHALFARGVEEWVVAIQALIDYPEKRHALAERAYHHAQASFGLHQAAPFWQPLIEVPERLATRRRRLLVINVFFAPQSVGGATRVAQDQVEAVLQQAGDRYEVTVLCVDKDPWQDSASSGAGGFGSLALDVCSWHGARVVRLALPPKPWSWHHDGEVDRFCRWWFAREGFDLIHAHCLQVLTAAPLRVAADLGIPYLVTLHDAWWLSPLQFLTTPQGQPVDLADPLGHEAPSARRNPVALEKAIERRNDLAAILAGATARLAVSESFAALYREAGIPGVEVLENTWTPMASVPRSPRRPRDPLRLCHVGGMAAHKGYAVLRAALLQLPHRGLELTVVDHSLEEGDDGYATHWSATPVRFIPQISMSRMASFYAEQDVLLAPSIWPESYGLVTREALSAGLWVVASDIGALADPIVEAVNGNRVPPGDPAALARVLGDLQKHGLPAGEKRPSTSSQGDTIASLLRFYDLSC